MLGIATKTDAVELLKEDHRKVKDLFEQFEKADGKAARKAVADMALNELNIHAAVEEELFYPAVRKELEEDIMNEADEEHHVAKVLIAELEGMSGDESHYEAKFMVLAENVKHHIKEEEGEMLPQAKKTKIDFEALGERIEKRKQALMAKGVPEQAEGRMVGRSRGQGDSPAHNARRKGTSRKKG